MTQGSADITSSSTAAATAIDASEAYQALVQFLYRAPIGLVETAADGAVQMINPTAARLLMPLSRNGTLDNLFDVLDAFAPQLRPGAAAACTSGAAPAEDGIVCDGLRLVLPPQMRRRDGDPEVLSLSVVRLDSQRLMAVLLDATADVQRERQGESRAARTDALTRMPNRAAAHDHVAQALARQAAAAGSPFALLFLNADRFGQINAAAGQAIGDNLLALMAERLRNVLREAVDCTPTLATAAARIGGDEFAVVLEGAAAPAAASAVAARLQTALGQPYGVAGRQLHCSVSIGLLLEPDAAHDADRALQDAGLAMAAAKRAGGGRTAIYEPGMHDRASKRSELEVGLRRAIDEQQLFVVYQPVVAMADGSLRSVEALVRWQHPERGLVSPVDFIGVAEECGLIGAICQFVLDTACADFAGWQARFGAAAPKSVAVNLSRAQLAEPALIADVAAVMQRHRIAPGQLQLEVTESLAAQDSAVQARLQELKALGLTLALDDFGTGYSSLASLHLLPVDTVKIDRSFVSQVDTSRHHRVLIEATVRVAQSLGMRTVAEGIETRAQADALRELGCERGQGFLFARPLALPQLCQWIEARVPLAVAAA